MNKFVLVIFAKSENQDEFVKVLVEEIVNILDNSKIGFCYGSESIILSIETKSMYHQLVEYLSLSLGVFEINYILVPYQKGTINYCFTPEIEKNLFFDKKSDNYDKNTFKLNEEQNLLFINDENDNENSYICNHKSQNQSEIEYEKPKTLDELLDKINNSGLTSLTKKELNLLENFSK